MAVCLVARFCRLAAGGSTEARLETLSGLLLLDVVSDRLQAVQLLRVAPGDCRQVGWVKRVEQMPENKEATTASVLLMRDPCGCAIEDEYAGLNDRDVVRELQREHGTGPQVRSTVF
jgi:hypothetical protein